VAPGRDDVCTQVAALGEGLLQHADELADAMVERIQAAVAVYHAGAISTGQLRQTCLDNVQFILGPLGRTPALSSPESRENGRLRAKAGVPLTAVMEAYRVGARYLWERLAQEATAKPSPQLSPCKRRRRCGWCSTRSLRPWPTATATR
jgi:hypothetical protein